MADQNKSTTRGKPFTKGQVANPRGRPVGLPDRRTKYRELIEARMPELVQKCVDLALQGDMQAMRLCLERVLPPVRPGDELVELQLDRSLGLAGQARAVIDAVFGGNLSPTSASTMMTAIAAQVRIVEVDELERRLLALESSARQS